MLHYVYLDVNEDVVLIVDWSTRNIMQDRVIAVIHRDRVPTHIRAVHLELEHRCGRQSDVSGRQIGTRTDHRFTARQGLARLNEFKQQPSKLDTKLLN